MDSFVSQTEGAASAMTQQLVGQGEIYKGMQLFACSWKLPAYNGTFYLQLTFFCFSLKVLAFLLAIGAFLLTVGKCV